MLKLLLINYPGHTKLSIREKFPNHQEVIPTKNKIKVIPFLLVRNKKSLKRKIKPTIKILPNYKRKSMKKLIVRVLINYLKLSSSARNVLVSKITIRKMISPAII